MTYVSAERIIEDIEAEIQERRGHMKPSDSEQTEAEDNAYIEGLSVAKSYVEAVVRRVAA